MSTTDVSGKLDESALHAALKYCSPATYAAARHFLQTRDATHLPAIITGMVERYAERKARSRLQAGTDPATLRLREDLGLDSLTMMEIVLLADEVLQVSISDDELSRLRTLGDVQSYFQRQLCAAPISARPETVPQSLSGHNPIERGFARV